MSQQQIYLNMECIYAVLVIDSLEHVSLVQIVLIFVHDDTDGIYFTFPHCSLILQVFLNKYFPYSHTHASNFKLLFR